LNYKQFWIAASLSAPFVPIQLSGAERHDLVAFMETLTGDGKGPKPRH